MRTLSSSKSIFLGVVAGLSLATGASALTIDSSNSGLDLAVGCTTYADCSFTTVYNLAASAPITGTLDIAGSTLTFNIQLASATLNAVGGSDGGVTSVSFSNTVYSGSVPVIFDGSNYAVDLGQVGAVSGTLTPAGAGSQVAFSASTVLVTGTCTGTPGSSLVCGLTFGHQLNFSAPVNGNTRYFQHTVDAFAAVPEPGTALLIGLGLFALGARRGEGNVTN